MIDRRIGGRRAEDNVITLANNPYTQETIEAFQSLYVQIFNTKPNGFGYFVIVEGLQYKWDVYGAARQYPELSIGILTKMRSALTHGK